MRIALLCATRRGYLFLEKLNALARPAKVQVFSFREEPIEPPFLDDIRGLAAESGAEFFETRKVADAQFDQIWKSRPDLIFVVSWRYLIPRRVHGSARLGTFVFHDSLLPRYRGYSPTVWAMINGEEQTGATLFEIADEVDAGDIIAQKAVTISASDTIATVMERVTESYLQILEENIESLMHGAACRHPQDHTHATFTCKRLGSDNRIDWTWPSSRIYNLIRAVTRPYSAAFSHLNGTKLRIWAAQPIAGYDNYVGRVPGRVIQVRPGLGTVVLTGDGALLLTEAQLEGQPAVCSANILNSLRQTLES